MATANGTFAVPAAPLSTGAAGSGAMDLVTPLVTGAPATEGIIVIQPGSYNLRIGFASDVDEKPVVVPHCIAWRGLPVPQASGPPPVNNNIGPNPEAPEHAGKSSAPAYLRAMYEFEQELIPSHQTLTEAREASRQTLNERNAREVLETSQDLFEWTNISSSPPYIVGEDALFLDPSDPYQVFFPFKHARLNRSTFPSNQLLLQSLQTIWSSVLVERFEIPRQNFRNYDVMLVLPDNYDPADVREMLTVLLTHLNFRSVFLHKESVCAALGAGYMSCLVVDIGFSKCTVSIVEDMDILEGSSFEMQYGTGDVTQALISLATQRYRSDTYCQYPDASMSKIQDMVIFEEMREAVCHYDVTNVKPKLYEFCVRRRNEKTVLYRMDIGLAQIGAPLALFYPELFFWVDRRVATPKFDPHDHHASIFSIRLQKDNGQTVAKKPKKRPTKKKGGGDKMEEDTPETVADPLQAGLRFYVPDEHVDHFLPISIQQAIIEAIASVSTKKVRQKLFERMLLIGGFAQMPGIKEALEDKVFELIPRDVERVDCLPIQTGAQPQHCAWKGGAMVASQTGREYWIGAEDWKSKGFGALRDRLPFLWDNHSNRKRQK